MRGTRGEQKILLRHIGIIPAHAGNTISGQQRVTGKGDHPRACGEHLGVPGVILCELGSSPRMRGTRNKRRLVDRRRGIIPAHAGNTWTRAATCSPAGDHPRACGEHAADSFKSMADTGSSPRMRGTPRPAHGAGDSDGIIPAHAGNTRWRWSSSSTHRDHPRACGEHM